MEHRTVTVADGIDLAVDEWRPSAAAWAATAEAQPATDVAADAPPFVLVHGLASNARLWDGVATALVAAGHPVFAVDLRGHGRSSKPAGPVRRPHRGRRPRAP